MIRIMLRRLDDERELVGQVIAGAAVELDPLPDAGQQRGRDIAGIKLWVGHLGERRL
jgi:hypothetical protein